MTRLAWQLIGTLLLVGFMLKYWWLIALVVAAVVLYKRAPGWWADHQAAVAAEQARLAAIAERADQQHAWVLAGDPRGTYGTKGTASQS
jgi:endonuclease/exonuclease/phosphatase (EEP) superfamily protein YafD